VAQNDLGETIGNEPDQNGAAQILNHEIAQLDDPSAQKSAAPLLDASFAGPQAGEPIPSDPIQQGGYMGDPHPSDPFLAAQQAAEQRSRHAEQEALINEQHARQVALKRETMEEVVRHLIEARRLLFHLAPCRESSLIGTKIETAILWAHAAMLTSPTISFGFLVTSESFDLRNFLAGLSDGKT